MTRSLPTIVMIATGGTIATKIDPALQAPVPALTGEEILASVPQIANCANLRVVNFGNLPSPCIRPEQWPKLAQTVEREISNPDVVGAIITHGTDTIDQSAYFLDLTLTGEKPVVLIGAQRNSSSWDADGPRNLINAVRQILAADSHGKGVTVTMNHYINAARYVRKSRTSNVQTFTSGDAGYLGYVDSDRVVFYYAPLRRMKLPLPKKLPRVDVISMYAGADGRYVRHAVETGSDGIVIEAFGLGHVNEPMQDAIEYAIGRDVPVIIATKVENGRALPVYGYKGGGKMLQSIGAVFAGDLSGDKAMVLCSLVMPITKQPREMQVYFDA